MPDDNTTLQAGGDQANLTDRQKAGETRIFLLAVAILAALTLAMFGDLLFGARGAVVSDRNGDLVTAFIPWRQFGFGELRGGNLALWNPHTFSGVPFFGGFQSALLYPPNFLYLLLPVGAAVNWSMALHVFLGGVFMYLWARHRGLSSLARLLAAVLFMFCGAHFLKWRAGHLPNACATIWAPLVLLAVDGLFRSRSFGWCLLGAFAVCMQILAGHPQYVFFTGVTVAIYTALCLVRSLGRWRIAAGLAGMYVAAAVLSAVQLLPGFEASGESVRSGGVPYDFASTYSFPPESFLTLVAPGFFGEITHTGYWGRWNYEEMSVFVGVAAVVLAVCGAVLARREARRFSITMAAVCLLLAMGRYTPLYWVLYHYVPGFDMFRCMSRYVLPGSLFIIMLAGLGLDELRRRRRACGRVALAAAGCAAGLGACALVLRASAAAGEPGGLWRRITDAMRGTEQSFQASAALGYDVFQDAAFVRGAGLFAAAGLLVAAGTLLALAGLLLAAKFSGKLLPGVALLAAAEVFAFAGFSRPTIEYEGPGRRLTDLNPRVRHVEEALSGLDGDYRILNPACPNSAMSTRRHDVWGEDNFVLKRYAELMAFTQGLDPDEAGEYVTFSRLEPLHRMLRWRFAFDFGGEEARVTELPDPMGRIELIRHCRVVEGRDGVFAAMAAEDFDPRQTVILETPPDPAPEPFAGGGSARVVDSSTDHLTIEADVPAPAILLITDTYAAGWRAVALPGSDQQSYDILPGNYALRAVPLAAGKHRLRMEYSPFAFRAGAWISVVSVAAYLALLAWCAWRRKRPGGRDTIESSPMTCRRAQ